MGISGLLPLLKSIHKPTHLRAWAGLTVAVDVYGWLHRGAISCAVELATGKPTRRYVEFAMNRVRLLQHFGVIPFIVFDGDYLPGKASEESSRQSRRDAAKARGLELLRLGKTSQGYLELQKAIDVTPEMAKTLIDELEANGVQYVVAPYEADAQMAYLERIGLVSGVLSEDSDLLVFGVKRLLTKLDQYGTCVEINRKDFSAVRDVSLAGWTDSDFRRMAILSGCDYLPNIPKMGLKTAHRLVRKYKSIEKLIQALRLDGSYTIPNGYEMSFKTADFTFQYQRAFCPLKQKIVHCNGESITLDDSTREFWASIGAEISDEIAAGVATGKLHPMTKKAFAMDQQEHQSSVKAPKQNIIKPVAKSKSITQFFAPKNSSENVSRNSQSLTSKDSLKRPSAYGNQRSCPERSEASPLSVLSNNRGNKRPRLCEEMATSNGPLQKSRFFASVVSKNKTVSKHSMTEELNSNVRLKDPPSIVAKPHDGGDADCEKENYSDSDSHSPDGLSKYEATSHQEWKSRFAFGSTAVSRPQLKVVRRKSDQNTATSLQSDDSSVTSAVEKFAGIRKWSYQQKSIN